MNASLFALHADHEHAHAAEQAHRQPQTDLRMVAGFGNQRLFQHFQGENNAFDRFVVFAGHCTLVAVAVVGQRGGAADVGVAVCADGLPAGARVYCELDKERSTITLEKDAEGKAVKMAVNEFMAKSEEKRAAMDVNYITMVCTIVEFNSIG